MTTECGKPSQDDEALAKYRALLPYLQGNVSLTRIAKAYGTNVRTVRRWLRNLEQKGFSGLKRRARADLGKTSMPAELKGLIEGLYLRRPPNLKKLQINSKISMRAKKWLRFSLMGLFWKNLRDMFRRRWFIVNYCSG